MKLNTIYALIFLLPSLLFGSQSELAKKRMLEDLNFLQQSLEVRYAPLEWKRSYVGLNLEKEFEQARKEIQQKPHVTTKEFQRLVSKVLNSLADYHVGAQFYSTERSKLPFAVKSALDPESESGRRYFIVHIDWSKISRLAFPLSVGDELLEWDGQPIDKVVKELCKQEFGVRNFEGTNLALAEETLTERYGFLGQHVPSGLIKLKFKSSKSLQIQDVVMKWEYRAERIKDFSSLGASKDKNKLVQANLPLQKIEQGMQQSILQQGMMVAAHFDPVRLHQSVENPYERGSRSNYLPNLGKVIWKSHAKDRFHAYIFSAPSGNLVGYIRIPHYMADEEETKEFCALMRIFENATNALVIDQMDNPGGSIFYLYSLASALANKPIDVPKHHINLTQEEVNMAVRRLPELESIHNLEDAHEVIGDSIGGLPVTMQTVEKMKQFFYKIIEEWNEGKLYTDPLHVFGIDKVTAHPDGCYTKPVLVLVNHLDFSGGDFFPAILQDSGRAVILGTRTAGAGGYVLATSHPNHNGIAGFTITGSVAERANKEPIENLGVKPDIEYAMQVEDLQHNYRSYVNKILETVESLLHKS
ncbi:MAG: protease-like activity factor CPAF [Verrucomicrobia bacterium]|nr:protease-like activity factor CPAF [Verrucomicrobiota bacterium]MBS0646882.1 protease-like activity factor CPAF [Verrucomicrobiota bacterium]